MIWYPLDDAQLNSGNGSGKGGNSPHGSGLGPPVGWVYAHGSGAVNGSGYGFGDGNGAGNLHLSEGVKMTFSGYNYRHKKYSKKRGMNR